MSTIGLSRCNTPKSFSEVVIPSVAASLPDTPDTLERTELAPPPTPVARAGGALPFAQKLDALIAALGTQSNPGVPKLVEAVLSDLAEEQIQLRQNPAAGGNSRDITGDKLLPRLAQLVAAAPRLKAQPGALSTLAVLVARLQAGLAAAHRTRNNLVPLRRGADVEVATATLLHRLRVGLFDHLRTNTGRAMRRNISASMHVLVAQRLTLEKLCYPQGATPPAAPQRIYSLSSQPVPNVTEGPWYRPSATGPVDLRRDEDSAVVRGGFGTTFLSLFHWHHNRHHHGSGSGWDDDGGGYGGGYGGYGGVIHGGGYGGGGFGGHHHAHGGHGGHGHGGFGGHGGHGGGGHGGGGHGGGGHGAGG